ncbi:hypothetical protein SAMN02745126_00382 [Enhydrobacter aerosaccus]|uniref:Uncharacterized protein n=2 Tax=Enhydrobacter aerosaccus TaxID=225324 RepID=A0A1T4JRD6_9HYPH|nr:hypothetical protein SAMN02745126_00382 [Enhydrobacter aerosaccus]
MSVLTGGHAAQASGLALRWPVTIPQFLPIDYVRPDRSVAAVIFGVTLARLAGVVRRVDGMTVRRVGVMRGFLVRFGIVIFGRFAMMARRLFVVIGCGLVVLDELVPRHHPSVQSSFLPSDCRNVPLQPHDYGDWRSVR